MAQNPDVIQEETYKFNCMKVNETKNRNAI